ncbi:hypothetical protein EAS64_33950 [Trebonia kvetii]|uniref:Uncharacterized protein n=1 Tax=Trebonia kvetii TaxID=2480626 RepID=A0A6P2BT05_9ACTN|nr:hypothetical protein [Trebonia kvetii]TVZ01285.1 hypothetical protein EAS64_33950 [Trebonia kvetii]
MHERHTHARRGRRLVDYLAALARLITKGRGEHKAFRGDPFPSGPYPVYAAGAVERVTPRDYRGHDITMYDLEALPNPVRPYLPARLTEDVNQ